MIAGVLLERLPRVLPLRVSPACFRQIWPQRKVTQSGHSASRFRRISSSTSDGASPPRDGPIGKRSMINRRAYSSHNFRSWCGIGERTMTGAKPRLGSTPSLNSLQRALQCSIAQLVDEDPYVLRIVYRHGNELYAAAGKRRFERRRQCGLFGLRRARPMAASPGHLVKVKARLASVLRR